MRLRLAAVLLTLGALGLVLWRAELFTVSRPGEKPLPLTRVLHEPDPTFDASLPVVPVGVARLKPGGAPLLVHYWAPWQHDSRAQITTLDSLVRLLPSGHVRVAVVCFDPFPSVARYIARLRVSVPVLLDLQRKLQAGLPCPSIPYTWLLDAQGHVLARQAGEVDWLAPETRALLLEAGTRGLRDTTAGISDLPGTTKPRRSWPPGLSRTSAVQARAAAADGRAKRRERAAYPPKSAAL
jgi:hypothetical protein